MSNDLSDSAIAGRETSSTRITGRKTSSLELHSAASHHQWCGRRRVSTYMLQPVLNAGTAGSGTCLHTELQTPHPACTLRHRGNFTAERWWRESDRKVQSRLTAVFIEAWTWNRGANAGKGMNYCGTREDCKATDAITRR